MEQDIEAVGKQVADLEFQRMFSGEMDAHNCFVDIQAGSGGTEAQDWANMLLRMYLMWGDRRGFKTEILEISEGEVAGIKGVTVRFTGPHAYGWLRTETGIHRLVRKSPFDAGNRRHTSFASVFVYPEVDDDIDIAINPADLRVDTYRASGAGGQHVNRTDSAIRITHLPTGIVVQCQSDRSQHRNRAAAMAMLKSRMYEREMQARNQEREMLGVHQGRHRVGSPDPVVRAGPVAHQGSAYRGGDGQHDSRARWRPRQVYRGNPQNGP